MNVGVLFFYYTRFLHVDEDDFGRWPLISEGMMPAFGVFLVTWTTLFTALHA